MRAILSQSGVEIDSQDLDSKYTSQAHVDEMFELIFCIVLVPEVQGTTREVAIAKCRHAAELLGGPCITEDTALCFEALRGLPGPYIKHFMKELGHEGITFC